MSKDTHMRGVPSQDTVPLVVVLALLKASVASGLDIRSALAGVGEALEGLDADAALLGLAAQRLAVGLNWDEAWDGAGGRVEPVARVLASSWRTGASPLLALEAAGDVQRHRTRSAADKAAAELGVRLTLPLALCMLPAFLLAGIVPLLLSIAAGVASVGA